LAEPPLLPLAWRLARRELRGGLKGFRVFLACLAIGVFAIAGVGSIAQSMKASLDLNARDLLGGDVEFRVSQRPLPAGALAWFAARGRVSDVHLLRAMLRRPDGTARAVVELKSVDAAYPLSGALALSPPLSPGAALGVDGDRIGIAVDRLLLGRLGASIGDRVELGDAQVEIRATIVKEPDSGADLFQLGPRVLISAEGLRRAGLDRPGTLNAEAVRVVLPAGADPATFIRDAGREFPSAAWTARDLEHASQGAQSFIDRSALFLSLIGLTALLVGGVGVGNAVESHLQGRAGSIATMKCLGAETRLVVAVYLLQILTIASGGIVVGAVAGAAGPWIAEAGFGQSLPFPMVLALFPKPLATACLFGLVTALVFSLLPLLRTRLVSPASLFRGSVTPTGWRLGPGDAVLLGLAITAEIGLTLATASDRRLAMWFLLAVAMAMATLWGLGRAVMFAARRAPPPGRAWLRLPIANLHRPGAPTGAVVLSLGLGLAVLVAVAIVEHSIGEDLGRRLAERAPSLFLIDIQPDQLGDFRKVVAGAPGIGELEIVPSLRTRVVAAAGVPIARARVEDSERALIQSDRGLSYAADLPRGSTLVAGQWWDHDYRGPPLVSLDERLAHGLHLTLGDTLTVDVAGRQITATIANLRHIDWMGFGINYFILFAPGSLEAAPQTALATVRAGTDTDEEALTRQVTDRFPNVSVIRVRDGLATVMRILTGLAAAIRATALVSLATGALVLSGAVASGHQRRLRDAVILKVLGATRAGMLRMMLVEYGLLGLASAGLAAMLGSLASFLLLTRLMDLEWRFDSLRVAAIVIAGTALTIGIAMASTWRTLSARAAVHLRGE
jgi:putative ABC transport system permease protein